MRPTFSRPSFSLLTDAAFAQLADNQVLAPLIVLASSSRLDSMAILRLRMRGKLLLDFPDSDDHRFFHYIEPDGTENLDVSQQFGRLRLRPGGLRARHADRLGR